jgi:hypothetical protein
VQVSTINKPKPWPWLLMIEAETWFSKPIWVLTCFIWLQQGRHPSLILFVYLDTSHLTQALDCEDLDCANVPGQQHQGCACSGYSVHKPGSELLTRCDAFPFRMQSLCGMHLGCLTSCVWSKKFHDSSTKLLTSIASTLKHMAF